MDESCPRGQSDCPVFESVEALRAERDRLLELTHVDPLTGLYNFRYLMSALERELERTRRTGSPTAVIMIDLDHFKSINDTHGHQAGNEALKLVAGLWRDNIRKLDIACRYGGEEFTIVLPASKRSHGVAIAERLRRGLESLEFTYRDRAIPITASFGVDCADTGETITAEELLDRADACLLRAKEGGRNRVWSRALPATGINRDEREALSFEF